MSETSIVTLALGLMTLLTGTGFWGFRQYKKEAPVKKRDADIAVAEKSQQMALAVAESLRKDMESLRERMDGMETKLEEQNQTIQKLREAVRLFHAAWDDLTQRWHVHRQSEYPPARPKINND
ncbi:hypothetical protein [Glutamicibacter creatinolyticus]|uniref:hypothetical protein n=1 Tax=Glutamicibacter creatinolyticus TaxID=162496 RepID=UPI0031DF1303